MTLSDAKLAAIVAGLEARGRDGGTHYEDCHLSAQHRDCLAWLLVAEVKRLRALLDTYSIVDVQRDTRQRRPAMTDNHPTPEGMAEKLEELSCAGWTPMVFRRKAEALLREFAAGIEEAIALKSICTYCGHMEESADADARFDAMSAHIVKCGKHPLREIPGLIDRAEKAEAEVAALRAKAKRLRIQRDEWAGIAGGYAAGQDAMKARLDTATKLLERARESVCSLKCPSVWRTADHPKGQPHGDECEAIRAFLASVTGTGEAHDVLCSKGTQAGDQVMPCDCDGPATPPDPAPEPERKPLICPWCKRLFGNAAYDDPDGWDYLPTLQGAVWRVVLWNRRAQAGYHPIEPGLTFLLESAARLAGDCPSDVAIRTSAAARE